jgi:hypothetical protein
MKKILLSIVMMALLAACGDSGSSPVAPAPTDGDTTTVTSSSSIEFRKEFRKGVSSSSVDTEYHAFYFVMYEVCDDFSMDALSEAATTGQTAEAFDVLPAICAATGDDAAPVVMGVKCDTWDCVVKEVVNNDKSPVTIDKADLEPIWDVLDIHFKVFTAEDSTKYILFMGADLF